MNSITVQVDTTDSAMFGPEPENTCGCDTGASIARYVEMLADRITAAYPDYEVEVSGGINSRIDVFTDEGLSDDIERDVEEIKGSLWQSWSWAISA